MGDGDGDVGGTDEHPTGPVEVHESFLHEEHPLHRPHHGRTRTALTCAVVFLLAPTLALVAGVRPVAFENRSLAALPSPAQGWGFLPALAPWASDHLPLRREAVLAAQGVSEGVFGEAFPFGEDGAAGVAGPVAPATAGQPRVPPAGAGSRDPDAVAMTAAGFPVVIQGRDGWLYYGLDAYAACRPQRPLADVEARLDRLQLAVERSGRTFELVVAPDKSSGAPDELPADYVGADCARAHRAAFWSAVDQRAHALDLRPALRAEAASSGEPVYFAQDTHWNYRAGLLAAEQVAEVLAPGSTATWRTSGSVEVQENPDLAALLGAPTTVSARIPLLDVGAGPSDEVLTPVDLHDLPVVDRPPAAGKVTVSTAIIGDSFVGFAWPALSAGFTQVQAMHVDTLGVNPANAAKVVAAHRAVVVVVAERTLASGRSALFSDQFLGDVERELAR